MTIVVTYISIHVPVTPATNVPQTFLISYSLINIDLTQLLNERM